MAKNELLPFANGEDANVLPTQQWEALTDILENGFQSGIARSEQVNRVLAQGAVASYVLGQLIVDQLNKDATLNKNTLYQNLVSALQENAKDVCLPLSGGTMLGAITMSGDVIKNKDATSWMTFFGGTNVNDGAGLELSGGSRSGSTGQFILRAKIDNNNVCQLNGRPNGELYWGGSRVITAAAPLVPDYSSGVAISSDTYTAPAVGIVILICTNNPKGPSSISVNGVRVSVFNNGAEYVDRTNFAFVNKGDVVTFETKGNTVVRKFYPLKVGG